MNLIILFKKYISFFIILLTIFFIGYYIGKRKPPKTITKTITINKYITLPDTSLIDSLNFLKKVIWKLKHQTIKPETVYVSNTDTIIDTLIIAKYGIEKGLWQIRKIKQKLSLYGFIKKQHYYFPFQSIYTIPKNADFIISPTSDSTAENSFKVTIIKPNPISYSLFSGVYYNISSKNYMLGLHLLVNYKRIRLHTAVLTYSDNLIIPVGLTFQIK